MKELEIWQFAAEKLEQNQNVVLMVVAESQGSSPGRPGFKMIVADDEICGSIGGGVMEVNLVEIAKEFLIMKDDEAIQKFGHQFVFGKYQEHRKDSPHSSGMICSGRQTVLFFKIYTKDLTTIMSIIHSLINNKKSFLEITKSGLRIITPEMDEIIEYQKIKEKFYFTAKEKRLDYLEKLVYKQNLYLIGGGHCALALSEIMSKLDFQISLFDDRADLNTLEKNRFAHFKTIIESYEQIAEFVPSGEDNYVVVMTLGYKFDEIVIRQLFDKNFKYFGVLGSRAKMKTLFKSLEKQGFDKEELAKIRTPIGLPINSHTPEEIAVSIAAEIIAVKNSPK